MLFPPQHIAPLPLGGGDGGGAFMIIKVCGMREAQNIDEVAALGVDLIGLIFYPMSRRYVSQLPTRAGIIPDLAGQGQSTAQVKKVGVFVDDMPQTILTRVVNYGLSYVQLHGNESPTMIENLKRTLIPDFVPEIGIIKALSVQSEEDVKRWRQYEGLVDYFLFDTKCPTVGGSGKRFNWDLLKAYDGNIPFLLSGGIGLEDLDDLKAFSHPMLAGYDLNSKFEDAPALKNIEKIKAFIEAVK